jgi:hypothetical protein
MKKNKIKIPVEFELFGQTIKIEWDEELHNKTGTKGLSLARENRIRLQKDCKAYTHLESDIEVTYLHEVLHWVFNLLGEFDLSNDEQKVDRIAHALHQVLALRKMW